MAKRTDETNLEYILRAIPSDERPGGYGLKDIKVTRVKFDTPFKPMFTTRKELKKIVNG